MAAAKFADLVRAKANAVIGLATGSTPEQTYAELAKMHRQQDLCFAGGGQILREGSSRTWAWPAA